MRRGENIRRVNDAVADTIAPKNAAELAEELRRCDAARLKVLLLGGGTLQGLGNPPARCDVTISTAKLNTVIEYDPRDLTIALGAGVTLRSLAATLAKHGQFVPIDAPHPDRATIGGTLAAGWIGPRRATYGRPRDYVIGTTAALADGTLSSAGGMVVKNVTGYDVSKLFVGSLGTLGALVRVNLKALPAPQTMRVAIASLPELTRERALEHIAALSVEPTAMLFVRGFHREIDGSDGLDGRLFVLYEGSQAVVDRATRELRSALGAAGVPGTSILDSNAQRAYQRTIDACTSSIAQRSLTLRSQGLPDNALVRYATMESIAEEHHLALDVIVDARTGDVFARFLASGAEAMPYVAEELVDGARERLSGLVVIAGDARVRASIDAWGPPPASFEKLRALKERFDPRGTLAPGRLVGGI
ncbi:MAG TPA: FAD-binding oxidoreductase [Candidatus Binatia bacterium]|nr:FAD-binding oxidoreductase [Candidatus Binatia bacterium]